VVVVPITRKSFDTRIEEQTMSGSDTTNKKGIHRSVFNLLFPDEEDAPPAVPGHATTPTNSTPPTIEGVYNFRDIAVGPTMRPRFIYRSSNIKVATDLGMQQLADLGVTTLIDLRSTKERLSKGNTAIPETMADLHYPLFLADRTEILDNTVIEFLSFLIQGPRGYAELFMVVCDNVFLVKTQWLPIFERLASPPDLLKPICIFCASGKDRTGLLAALLQLLGGANSELIIEDFAQTAKELPTIDLQLLKDNLPDIQKLIATIKPTDENLMNIFASDPKSMELFLRAFHQKYSSVENFFLSKIGTFHVYTVPVADHLCVCWLMCWVGASTFVVDPCLLSLFFLALLLFVISSCNDQA